ncbi:phospholipase A [Halomonas llamarensis]|uniref:Phospholipase A1 n=1 Tax=Halomonas llamarensis TaxID=2945104 RepID=A0ABT0SQ09_9GAMM|nr:phospholipase A [Halomonas llamarensis]MCL7929827.1 phospholipase A [Halomonas llamarensis]
MVTRYRWLATLLSLTLVVAVDATAQEPTREAEAIEARIQALNSELSALNAELDALEKRQEDSTRRAFFERADMQTPSEAQATAIENINERRELEQASNRNPFSITTHRTNYLLPLSYNANPSRDNFRSIGTDAPPDNAELKFQFSTKVGIASGLFLGQGDLYFGYTQRSWWQAFNTDASSPFRETNYEPELFIDFDNAWNIFGWVNARNRIALNHQSNGRSDTLSRSWNRIYAESIFQRGEWAIVLSPHWRIPEAKSEDDNPDIHHYMGYGDIRLAKRLNRDHEIMAQWRGNPKYGNYGTQIDYSWPTFNNLRAHVQYYYGYGESLIDYDHRVHRLSIGFSLNPLFTPTGLNR